MGDVIKSPVDAVSATDSGLLANRDSCADSVASHVAAFDPVSNRWYSDGGLSRAGRTSSVPAYAGAQLKGQVVDSEHNLATKLMSAKNKDKRPLFTLPSVPRQRLCINS